MTLQIFQCDPRHIMAVEGITIDMPVLAYVGVDDEQIVGSGGLAWSGGRCWVWLRTSRIDRRYSITIVHCLKRMLRKAWQLGEEEVFTPRDTEYDTSERLLKALGFQMHGIEEGQEVWRLSRQ
jgi:hypothetical protein